MNIGKILLMTGMLILIPMTLTPGLKKIDTEFEKLYTVIKIVTTNTGCEATIVKRPWKRGKEVQVAD